MKTIMLLCVVAMLGCNAPPSYQYVISLDPKMSDDWLEAAWNAADSWQAIVDGRLGITFNYTGCLHQDHEICIYPSTKAAILAAGGSPGEIGFCRHEWYTDSSEILIPVDQDKMESPVAKQQLLTHEFGHGFAIDFHLTPGKDGAVMCFSDTCASLIATCQDASAYFAQRESLPWGWQGNKTCPPTGYTVSGK